MHRREVCRYRGPLQTQRNRKFDSDRFETSTAELDPLQMS
jgi:hypothetical protein